MNRPALLITFIRQSVPVSLLALPVFCLFILFHNDVLEWRNWWTALFVLVHSIIIAVVFGRFRSTSFAYLYTRGYSRDAIWRQKMLATVLAVVVVWLPAALLVWLPVRSAVQDNLFMSPYFPLMRGREMAVPFFWLFGYGILLPVFHYVWIRRAQPTRGGNGAVLLAIGVVIAGIVLMDYRWHPEWFQILVWIVSAVMASAALVGGLLLHRMLEVQR